MIKIKKIFSIFFIISLSSCGILEEARKTKLYHSKNLLGTSSAKIIKKYGLPDEEWQDKDGNDVFGYSYSEVKYKPSSFLPIPLTNSRHDNYEIVLTFNKTNELIDIRKFVNQVVVKSWTLCEAAVANCNVEY